MPTDVPTDVPTDAPTNAGASPVRRLAALARAPLSRRQLFRALGGVAAAAALPGLAGGRARAAQDASAAGAGVPQGAGLLTGAAGGAMDVLKAASFQFDAATIAASTDAAEVEALLAEHGVPLPLAASVSVPLRTAGDELVLIDAGPAGSPLPAALAAAGHAPEAVTRVVVSHWHPDHLGGTVSDGAPAFPNATVLFPAEELAFLEEAGASGEGGPAGALAQVRTLQDAGVLETYGDGDEVAPGVQAVAAFGHTPGHHAFVIDGALLHIADAAANPLVSLARPEWAFSFDGDPERATETRRRLLERAADETLILFASHFPFPGLGYVARAEDGSGFRFTPTG